MQSLLMQKILSNTCVFNLRFMEITITKIKCPNEAVLARWMRKLSNDVLHMGCI